MERKSTMVELVEELRKLPESPEINFMIEEALAGEYHDYKNEKYVCGKLESSTRLRSLGYPELAQRIEISQKDIAQLLFKDHASITRMIELLVRKEYLSRKTHKEDGRKFQLIITKKGSSTLETLKPIIFQNRIDALNGVSGAKINQLYNTLNTIINNCTN